MKRWVLLLGMLVTMIYIFDVVGFAKITVDTSDASQGYITVKSDEELTKRIKVRIIKGTDKVTHDLVTINEDVPYALTFGEGNYEVKIFENQKDNLYSVLQTKTFNVKLEDENKVYLNSTNEINWNENQEVIKIAKEITKDLKTDEEKIQAVYNFVTATFVYDYSKISTLKFTYKPDLDKVYEDKKGICYDYSVTFAGMLRSIGIPTKLVKGYNKLDLNTYHAWNEVLVNNEWKTVDTTVDSYKLLTDTTVEMYKSADAYTVSGRY